jgi:predicted secreted protein
MRHVMDDPASGAAATLHPGDALEVRLRQPGGAGYLWSVVAVPDNLEPRGDRTETAGMPGAAGARSFRFEASGPGTGVLRLTLSRPWEESAAETRELSVSVIRG